MPVAILDMTLVNSGLPSPRLTTWSMGHLFYTREIGDDNFIVMGTWKSLFIQI